VTQVMRRLLSMALLASLIASLGGLAGLDVAAASARPVAAGSSPGQPPGGGVKVLGEKFDGFCVQNFKPHSTVKVTNTLTGKSVFIHTDAKGDGCADVPLKRACNAVTQRIVATGIGNDGKPARVSAIVRSPAVPSLCASTSRSVASSGGTLPFTGADIALMVAIALVLIGAGTATVLAVRRRRQLV
jgi:hypothetical protein